MRNTRDVSPLKTLLLISGFFAAAIFALVSAAPAESEPVSPPAPATDSAPAAQKEGAPAPIPLAEIAPQIESTSARVRDLQAELSSDRVIETVAQQLPLLTREIDARLSETRKIVAQRPSLEMLARLEADAWRLSDNLDDWSWSLTGRVTRLDREISRLDTLTETWEPMLKAVKAANAPPEIRRRIESVLAQISRSRQAVDAQRGAALAMQSRASIQTARVAEALAAIAQARADVLNRLFVKDSPPIWSAEVRTGAPYDLLQELRGSFAAQWTALRAFAERDPSRFFIHLAALVALAAVLYWARRRLEDLAASSVVLQMPLAAALMLSVFCARWVYPQAPRLLWAALIALALIPSVIILRRLINGDLRPIFHALVAFFFIDQVRAFATAVQLLPRLLFMAEMLGATVFLLALLIAKRRARSGGRPVRLHKTIAVAAWAGLLLSALAFTTNALGYVTFGNLLGNALLGSAYLALILYAIVSILDGLLAIVFKVGPMARLGIARRHTALLRARVYNALKWTAVGLWILGTLNRLLLRDRLFGAAREVLAADLGVGALRVTIGDALAFILTVWAAFVVSRFVRFLLEEDIYPRVRLTSGLPYAISTTLHYIILLVGFFAAVTALGLDMTKVTILAGAFSVGVGFGLQNIFNNFVSGLILLFERPVKIGDVVQIEDASGTVEHIGIRASIIRTPNGSEIIVPNGKLISERVTNWTLSNRRRTIELPIAVAQGADPDRVIALLERTAAAHPLVTDEPPPEALVVKLSPDSLGFELRAWTDRIEQWMQIRSELAITVSAALAAEKIAIR
jgi:potassium efflux system protein